MSDKDLTELDRLQQELSYCMLYSQAALKSVEKIAVLLKEIKNELLNIQDHIREGLPEIKNVRMK